ncbi:MAG: preprotein translocase subunit SecA, partial [Patescibacteria group bacterium]
MMSFLTKILGDSNKKFLKKLEPIVSSINSLEEKMKSLSDEGLRGVTEELKGRLNDGEKADDILPEAFAVTRESARRTLKQRHFDVQLLGGIVLHQGK